MSLSFAPPVSFGVGRAVLQKQTRSMSQCLTTTELDFSLTLVSSV